MNGYEKLVEQMRKAGKYYNAPIPQIGVVKERGKISLCGIDLDTKDYLMNCNLRLDDKEKVYFHSGHTSSGDYVTNSVHNSTLKEYKDNVLYPGDKVLMLKLDKQEKYILLEKVVSPK